MIKSGTFLKFNHTYGRDGCYGEGVTITQDLTHDMIHVSGIAKGSGKEDQDWATDYKGAWNINAFEIPNDNDELTELRKFRDDAIAKYPDLAPMSEEDEFILAMYNRRKGTSLTHISSINDLSMTPAMREAIQWGKDHA